MTNKQSKRRLLLFILVLAIPLMISIGLSLWIISDNIKVKPELEIEDVIIKYLDNNETEYDGNIQLPSNTYLGLANELTYYYKQLDDTDYTLVDLTNRKGPINADDYLIKVVYYEEVQDEDTQEIITVEKTITGLTFKINKATIDTSLMEFNSVAKEYTGYPQSIAVSGVIPEEITNVTYEGSGINVGTYSITANFEYDTANYKEVKSMNATLTITQKDISKISYKFTGNETGVFTYVNADIEEIKTSLVLTNGSITLIESTETEENDYTITFENIKDVGTYTVYAQGRGNYTGELAIKYTIINAVLTITFDNHTFTYTGSEIDLEKHLTIKNAQGVDITPDSLSYQHKLLNAETFEDGLPINATAYKVIITAEHAEYQTATKEIEITIGKADISKAEITLVSDSLPYNGSAQNASISSVTFKADSAPQINLYMGDDYLNPTCANNTDAGTATITITGTGNFSGTAKQTYAITPIDPTINFPTISAFAEGGTPTITAAGSVTGIGGATVSGELSMNSTTGIVYPTNSAATASVEITYSFASFNKNYNSLNNVTTTATMKAVAKIGSTYYGTIKKAVDVAKDGSTKKVDVIHDLGIAIPVRETFIITSGVSLYVTYDGTKYEVGESGIEALNATTFADANATSVASNRKTLINLTNNADIIIASGGNLYLGGQTRRIGVTGLYTEINLDTGSGIEVSGNFYCYGYVKENASTAKHGNQTANITTYSNSFDGGGNVRKDGNDADGRLISIKSGGTLKTIMGFYDFKSAATDLLSLNDAGVFPLNIFDFNCLQTYTQVESGGNLLVQSYLVATTSVANKAVYQEVPIVKASGAMFNLISGTCAFEYCPNNVNYTSTTSLTRIFIDGAMEQGYVTLTIDPGIGGVQTITTSDRFIPISYKLNIYINDGGSFDTKKYKIKILPGSLMKINSGGTLNISSDVIFYEGTHSGKLYNYGTKNDAVLINNGNIVLTSAGKLAANIETEVIDNSALLNFSACANSGSFTVTSVETETAVAVTRTAEGLFVDDSSEGKSLYQFMPGTVVYSDQNGNKCWDGEKNTIRNIIISISTTGYTKDIYNYEIYVADDNKGTNSTPVTSGATSTTGTYEIPLNKYVMIKVTRAAGSVFVDGTAHSNSTWYLVEDNMELIITPNEGILLTVQTYANSGNGQTGFYVYESSTQNGTFEEIAYLYSISKETVYLVKGYYFKIVTNGGTGTTVLDSNNYYYGLTTNYKPVSTGDFTTGSIGKFKENTAYLADDAYTVYFHRKSLTECIAAGTLITLWDGSKKPVEEITKDDLLLVFNHETGQYEFANIIFIDDDGWKTYRVINLVFSNGQTTKVIYEHGFYDLDLDEYVYIREDNYQDYIGHKFHTGELINGIYIGGEITLEDVYITEEYTGCYSPVTVYHMNYYTDSLLSMPGGITGLFNIFEMNDDLTINLEKMQEDIDKYGLYTYEDFKDYIPYEVYAAFPAPYFKVAVGKGYITWEEILGLIDRYLSKMV